jgi:hypothetical protein
MKMDTGGSHTPQRCLCLQEYPSDEHEYVDPESASAKTYDDMWGIHEGVHLNALPYNAYALCSASQLLYHNADKHTCCLHLAHTQTVPLP